MGRAGEATVAVRVAEAMAVVAMEAAETAVGVKEAAVREVATGEGEMAVAAKVVAVRAVVAMAEGAREVEV